MIKSPLRYPGGKYILREYMKNILEINNLVGCRFYEPFAGSAALSLYLLSSRYISHATLIEKDPFVFSFLYCMLNMPKELCEKIDSLEISIDEWKIFKHKYSNLQYNKINRLELAVTALYLNRTCFSGIMTGGPIGGFEQKSQYKLGCRFNKKEIIERILSISELKSKITLRHGDAFDFLDNIPQKINEQLHCIYIDPPYFKNGKKLYSIYFNQLDHERLSKSLSTIEANWILSYDYDPKILNLYNCQKVIPLKYNYRVRNKGRVNELLFSNLSLFDEDSINVTPTIEIDWSFA